MEPLTIAAGVSVAISLALAPVSISYFAKKFKQIKEIGKFDEFYGLWKDLRDKRIKESKNSARSAKIATSWRGRLKDWMFYLDFVVVPKAQRYIKVVAEAGQQATEIVAAAGFNMAMPKLLDKVIYYMGLLPLNALVTGLRWLLYPKESLLMHDFKMALFKERNLNAYDEILIGGKTGELTVAAAGGLVSNITAELPWYKKLLSLFFTWPDFSEINKLREQDIKDTQLLATIRHNVQKMNYKNIKKQLKTQSTALINTLCPTANGQANTIPPATNTASAPTKKEMGRRYTPKLVTIKELPEEAQSTPKNDRSPSI